MTMFACDALVQTVERVPSARDRSARRRRDGHAVGLRAAGELHPRIDVIVVFTDGYTPWPEAAPPGLTVIAALLGRVRHPMPPTHPGPDALECAR